VTYILVMGIESLRLIEAIVTRMYCTFRMISQAYIAKHCEKQQGALLPRTKREQSERTMVDLACSKDAS
jgi:hypothetical protein